MPVEPVLNTPNSVRKRPNYNANQRINAKTVGSIPGLEDDIVLFPKAIAEIIQTLFDKDDASLQLFGGQIESFSINSITTKKGLVLKSGAIHGLEPLVLTPTGAAFWGFYEIQLIEEESDAQTLAFWDAATKSPFQGTAPTRKSYRIQIRENYNNTAVFPSVSSGWTKWISYKKAGAFGNILEVSQDLASITFPDDRSGEVAMNEDILDLQNQIANLTNFQVPLGGITEDPLNILPAANFRDVNGGSFNRGDAPELIPLLIKSVTSMNPSTDRINAPAHTKAEGELVKFGFTIGGITALTHYFVRNPTLNDFQVSLTATGSIVNITADGTGEMLTNVEWGFGNGSTTANVPDRRGIFKRNSGVHGSRAKAAGGNYDGGAVGSEGQDRFQGHTFPNGYASGASVQSPGGGTNSPSTTGNPISDGTNGTPRSGNETTPAWIAVREKVRIA